MYHDSGDLFHIMDYCCSVENCSFRGYNVDSGYFSIEIDFVSIFL